jgi:hypothetical protein
VPAYYIGGSGRRKLMITKPYLYFEIQKKSMVINVIGNPKTRSTALPEAE